MMVRDLAIVERELGFTYEHAPMARTTRRSVRAAVARCSAWRRARCGRTAAAIQATS